MKILVKRIYKGPKYTIGKLYVDDKYVCDTLEDKDRGLTQDMPIEQIQKIKVKGETAIPTGTYKVTQNIISPKYSKSLFYQQHCNGGRVPRLLNVPGFDGILVHAGNSVDQSLGCLLAGYNKVVGKVINSREACQKLYKIIKGQTDLTITIV